MSYDGYIVHADADDTNGYGSGTVFEIGNSTTNHSKVWSAALQAAGMVPASPDERVLLRDTNGWTVQKAGPLFAAAAAHIRANWGTYDAMHPISKLTGQRTEWYSLEHATKFLETAAAGCREFERYSPAFKVYWSS